MHVMIRAYIDMSEACPCPDVVHVDLLAGCGIEILEMVVQDRLCSALGQNGYISMDSWLDAEVIWNHSPHCNSRVHR
jgi:hypothetical protein